MISDAWADVVANKLENEIKILNVSIPTPVGKFMLWVSYLHKEVCGKDILKTRNLWSPSAMVSTEGKLYTLSFVSFNSADGPHFQVNEFSFNETNKTISSRSKDFCFWSCFTTFHCKYDLVKAEIDPMKLISLGPDEVQIKTKSHNALSPTIAQEVSTTNTSDTLYIVGWLPPGHWGDADADIHGLFKVKIKKDSLTITQTAITQADLSMSSGMFGFNYLGDQFYVNNQLSLNRRQPQSGNYRALYDGNHLKIYHLGHMSRIDAITHFPMTDNRGHIYSEWVNPATLIQEKKGYIPDPENDELSFYKGINTRFCFQGNLIHFSVSNGSNETLFSISNNGVGRKFVNRYCTGIENEGISQYNRYDNDFCVLSNGTETIFCALGFKYNIAGNSGANISWENKHLICLLYSTPLSGINWQTYPQNTIYTTRVNGGDGSAVDTMNTTAADDKRLYLNTQKIVPYTTANGHTYMIYAYCYPGNKKQLYLGFAPHSINASNHVVLHTMTEFRDKNGDSFGNFTDCSRIVTMDLKNNHLWITFMNSNSTAYYCFHILASDLVGE